MTTLPFVLPMQPTRQQMDEFEKLVARMAGSSRYATARAAFEMGLRMGANLPPPPSNLPARINPEHAVIQSLAMRDRQHAVSTKFEKFKHDIERLTNPAVNESEFEAGSLEQLGALKRIAAFLRFIEAKGTPVSDDLADYFKCEPHYLGSAMKPIQARLRLFHKDITLRELVEKRPHLKTQVYSLTDMGRTVVSWIPRHIGRTPNAVDIDVYK
jgi:hypothetical protein